MATEHEQDLAKETMCQLFFDGPVWDGNLASKTGRDVLVDLGLAERGAHGLQWLTRAGIERAVMLGWNRYKESGPRMSAYEAWKRMA